MDYYDLRIVHIALATTSLAGFLLRWTWMINGDRKFEARLTRILPHVIDTLFLASGIVLAYAASRHPLYDGWLTAKLLGLVAYIILGSYAMQRAESRHGRILAFLAAISVFAWMVSVARLKSPWGFVSYLWS